MRLTRLLAIALVAVGAWSGTAHAQEQAPGAGDGRIDIVQVNGLLDPPNAALLTAAIADAEAHDASLLVLQIDGSGAIDVDVSRILRAMETTTVPIAAWVGPSGGGASGASALVALAAGYTGVAPGADLDRGAPVYYDDPGRTVEGASQYLDKPVADRAPTLQDFVAGLDGKTISPPGVQVTTLRGEAPNRRLSQDVHFRKLDLVGQLSHKLATPWVAYFLFVVGLLLIVFEFFTAGVGIAGFVGAVSLAAGCFGFSHLPVNLWAAGLLIVGVVGLSVDLQAGGLGAWTVIGTVALALGSVFLYGGSPRLDPRWWVLVLVIGGAVFFMVSGMTAMVRSRFSTPTIGRDDLVGELGRAEVDVSPDGVVRVRDALWKARTNRATPIAAGDAVRVVSIEGIVLEVEPEAGGARDYRERRHS